MRREKWLSGNWLKSLLVVRSDIPESMIDTHTHPYLEEFEDGGITAVDRALSAGVSHMILPNVGRESVLPMESLHAHYPKDTSMAMGLHPTEVRAGWETTVDEFEKALMTGRFVAVGEVGIDLYWDKTHREEQNKAFRRQLEIAHRLRLPVIIHCRDGLDDVLKQIAIVRPEVTLVFHSFTGSADEVRRIREVCDPMFGINGVSTYKNARPLHEAIPTIGLDRILLETDAPYLSPVPYRGRRNEPAYVAEVCRRVGALIGATPENVERITDQNAKNTFSL